MNEHLSGEMLSALADGECDPTERRYAHEHLQGCPDCSGMAEQFAAVRGLVGALGPQVAPESLVVTVLAPPRTLRGTVAYALRGPRRYVAGGLTAAAVAISVAGLAAPPQDSEPPVEVFVTRHVGVNAGSASGGEVLFAVSGR